MTVSEKIKTIENTIEPSKTQYDLDRQTTEIWALSSGNVNKYEILAGEKALPEKELLEKSATIKRLQYSSLGSELKKTNSHCKSSK